MKFFIFFGDIEGTELMIPTLLTNFLAEVFFFIFCLPFVENKGIGPALLLIASFFVLLLDEIFAYRTYRPEKSVLTESLKFYFMLKSFFYASALQGLLLWTVFAPSKLANHFRRIYLSLGFPVYGHSPLVWTHVLLAAAALGIILSWNLSLWAYANKHTKHNSKTQPSEEKPLNSV